LIDITPVEDSEYLRPISCRGTLICWRHRSEVARFALVGWSRDSYVI